MKGDKTIIKENIAELKRDKRKYIANVKQAIKEQKWMLARERLLSVVAAEACIKAREDKLEEL